MESPARWTFVPLEEDAEVPSRGRFGAGVRGRTVAAMNTLTALTSVVASHSDYDGHWFPFAFFWLVLVALVVWFVVRGGPWRHHRPSDMDRARGILAERFARGEISGEEYREKLEQLR